jgi:hypothetical protein
MVTEEVSMDLLTTPHPHRYQTVVEMALRSLPTPVREVHLLHKVPLAVVLWLVVPMVPIEGSVLHASLTLLHTRNTRRRLDIQRGLKTPLWLCVHKGWVTYSILTTYHQLGMKKTSTPSKHSPT